MVTNTLITNGHLTNRWILKVVAFFWLIAKLISWKLWLAYRLFPLVPPFAFLHVQPWFHAVLFAASILLLKIIIIRPVTIGLLAGLLCFEVVSCLFDQNRWQPWQYQYMSFLLIYLVFYKKQITVLTSLIFIVVTIYVFSGLAKFNANFTHNIWQKLILIQFLHLPAGIYQHNALLLLGFIIPVIEVGAGMCLFFTTTKRWAACVLIAMHLFNLLFLGPFGLRVNQVVWPWNVAMVSLLYLLFIQANSVACSIRYFFSRNKWWVLLVWGLLPFTSFAGLWDNYLSFALYTGSAYDMVVCVDTTLSPKTNELKPYLRRKPEKAPCNNSPVLSVRNWCNQEIKVPCYPERRVLLAIKTFMQNNYGPAMLHFSISAGGAQTKNGASQIPR